MEHPPTLETSDGTPFWFLVWFWLVWNLFIESWFRLENGHVSARVCFGLAVAA